MSLTVTPDRPLRVAVIGSGPSGIYAAEALLKSDLNVDIDVFDRLPTPYGLVRYGVAPDHLTIKSVTRGFEKTLGDPRVRFLGNVEFGTDLTHQDALTHYDAILYTVGASSDRRLGIPGEDLTGSMSATEFVAWYNGHPDAAAREMVLNAGGVAVVGVGNVALDVSRILAKTTGELRSSDIAPHALDALEHSAVKDVWILGRRGPAQAAFTTKELREFGELHESEPVVDPAEIALTEAEEAAVTDNVKKKNIEVLRDFAAREREGKPRRVHLRFLVSPTEIIDDGTGHVGGLKVERNRLDESGNAVGTGEYEVLPVQMVLRSVGYRGVALPGVPFDERRGVIPNEEGRVEGRVGEYTAGWIKRGPSGVVGTN
ncbi:FAD-dependent oxidoreductase, partial [Deinococcus sp. 12RED42]